MTSRYAKRFEKIAYGIFSAKPKSNHFTIDDWDNAVEDLNLPENECDSFRNELLRIGYIVNAGIDDKGDECFSFIHRTLLEFTAAKTLSKRGNWLEEARKHFWDFTWLETLTFLAGLVDDVKPLIEAVRREEPDIFGTMILLEAKFTGVSNTTDVELICDKIIFGLLDKYWGLGFTYKPEQKNEIIDNQTISEELLNATYQALQISKRCRDYFFGNLINRLIETLDNSENNLSLSLHATEALVKLRNAKNKVIDFLIETLANSGEIHVNSESEYWSRGRAANQLIVIGEADDKAIDVLIAILNNADNYRMLRNDDKSYLIASDMKLLIAIAQVLAHIGNNNDKVINFWIEFIRNSNNDSFYRGMAAEFLGKIKVIDVLIETLTNLDDDYQLRIKIAEVLVETGQANDTVIDFLIEDLINKNSGAWLCSNAPKFLGKFVKADDKLINCLIETLSNSDDYYSRRIVALTLSELGVYDDKTIDVLIEVFRESENDSFRLRATKALGKIGMIDVLVESLSNLNRDYYKRIETAEVLVETGQADDTVTDFLIETLSTSKMAVWFTDRRKAVRLRMSAAEALMKTAKANDKVIDFLIKILNNSDNYGLRNDELRNVARNLSKICETRKDEINRQCLIIIIKSILRYFEKYRLYSKSDFTKPLFQIWQTFRTNENDLKITWNLLDMDEKDFPISL